MRLVQHLYCLFLYTTERLSPLMMLILRLWIGGIFWRSGILKLSHWDTTLTLFMYEHPVPLLPVPVAAFLGTAFELACPVLLALGLASRLAALPLILMTLVINYTYVEATEHYYWLLLLGTILCQGPGALSMDALIRRRYGQKCTLA